MDEKIVRKYRSARTLVITSPILLILGLVILDPTAGIFFFALAGLLSLVSAIMGTKKVRYTSIVIISVAIVLSVLRFPDSSGLYNRYLEKAAEKSSIENRNN